jgi:hypothetical protein
MADVTVVVNGYEYSEEKFRKDLTRMFDAYRDKEDRNMGNMNCNGVSCDVCPLHKSLCCKRKTTNSFETIGLVYEWALKHPAMTNQKKLEEVFGKEIIDEFGEYIHFDSYGFYKWMGQEYKKPKGESKNDD